jgi:5'-methylthioadenosine/S-adenosylhomocysteine nucleosidase
MKEEANIIIKKFNLKSVKKFKTLEIFEWEKNWIKIVLILAWIWKIQASLATTYLFENYIIEKLINIWIAGNISNQDIKVWDVFLPNTFIQHDMYLPFDWEHLDYAKKAIFIDSAVWINYDLKKFWLIMNGICLTWDQFIDDEKKIKELKEKFSWDLVEMEAFAILSVAREYEALNKCIIIKAVSDWADSTSKDDHMSNLDFAMNNATNILELIL